MGSEFCKTSWMLLHLLRHVKTADIFTANNFIISETLYCFRHRFMWSHQTCIVAVGVYHSTDKYFSSDRETFIIKSIEKKTRVDFAGNRRHGKIRLQSHAMKIVVHFETYKVYHSVWKLSSWSSFSSTKKKKRKIPIGRIPVSWSQSLFYFFWDFRPIEFTI